MSIIYDDGELEEMANTAEKDGCGGLIRSLRLRGLVQIVHLVSSERYEDACKVVSILERMRAI